MDELESVTKNITHFGQFDPLSLKTANQGKTLIQWKPLIMIIVA